MFGVALISFSLAKIEIADQCPGHNVPHFSVPARSISANGSKPPTLSSPTAKKTKACQMSKVVNLALALREGQFNVRLVKADVLTSQRVNQLLIHAIGGAQMKFALQIVEVVDRAGLGARQLHRLSDDGGEHG